MTGAMYASIAGLRAHMDKLGVIGNNVANVNTYAYKTKRTVFRDSLYRTYSSGSNGTAVVGGKNPSEIGYGSMVASIDMDMSSASYAPGKPMDTAIVGDGFFLVGDKTVASVIDAQNPNSFKALTLTRLGDFKVGPDNYLVDGTGKVVYGFMNTGTGADQKGDPIVSDQLVGIRMPRIETTYYDALDHEIVPDENGKLPANTVIASTKRTVKFPMDTPQKGGNTGGTGTDVSTIALRDYWPAWALDENNAPKLDENPLPYATFGNLSIDKNTGCITGVCKETSETVVIGYLAIGNVSSPDGVSHEGSSYYRCGNGAGDLGISLLGGAAEELGITHVNGSLAKPADNAGNGNTTDEVELDDKALIGSGGNTELLPGFVETSGADLATEISELITTQRGYQANTRIITVTDSMLEELVNMKR